MLEGKETGNEISYAGPFPPCLELSDLEWEIYGMNIAIHTACLYGNQ